MSANVKSDLNTRQFILEELPVAKREDDAVIEQDAGRAAVLAQYTLMAKKPVDIPTTGTADAGNTGDGTVTAVAAALGGSPVPGTWELELIAVIAHGGIFKLTDPNGNIVDSNITLNPGAGLATVFTVAGMTFTITDGAADFILADLFTIAVTANGKWVPFDITAVDGSEIPEGFYMGEDITVAAMQAADVLDNPIIFFGAVFDEGKAVFDDGSTVFTDMLPAGLTVTQWLRHVSLIPRSTLTTSLPENA